MAALHARFRHDSAQRFCDRSTRIATCAARPRAALATALPPWAREPLESARRAADSPRGQQAAVGGLLGFATGYAVRRVGQLLLVIVGAQTVALHLMGERGWVAVDWDAIARDLSPHVHRGRFDRFAEALQRKLPFGAAFSAACYAGLQWR